MARKKHNELVAGAFVILTLCTLIGVVVWMGGAGILLPTKQRATFFAKEETGSIGLEAGAFVQIGDDQIGKIAKIRFDPDTHRTLYTAEIERGDFKIHSDGKAHIAAALIGGARLVILSRGSEDAPLADEQHPIELDGGLDQAMSNLSAAAQKVSEIADVIREELDAKQSGTMLARIHALIDSLETAAARAAEIALNIKVETEVDNPKAMFYKLHRSVNDVNKMTTDAQPKIEETLTAVRDTVADIRQYAKKDIADILTQIRQANTRILKIAGDISIVSGQAKELALLHRDNIDEMLDNMTQVSSNLKAASKEIRRNPWRLIHKPDDKELDSANINAAAWAFSNGAEQLDQAIAKMTGLAKAHPEGLAADDPALLKIREQLEEAFGKFNKVEQALWKELGQ